MSPTNCPTYADGLTDCEDPECCGSPPCDKSQLCVSAKKPTDILLRKQPPAITASFFEKMKFLIEEGSLQSYARQDAFNGRYELHSFSQVQKPRFLHINQLTVPLSKYLYIYVLVSSLLTCDLVDFGQLVT